MHTKPITILALISLDTAEEVKLKIPVLENLRKLHSDLHSIVNLAGESLYSSTAEELKAGKVRSIANEGLRLRVKFNGPKVKIKRLGITHYAESGISAFVCRLVSH